MCKDKIRGKAMQRKVMITLIIPTNQLFQYAVMLHYCVTGRRITTNDIQFTEKASQNPSSSEINLITEEHRGVWMAEQEFMNMLREGNPNYLDALARSYSLSDGPRFDCDVIACAFYLSGDIILFLFLLYPLYVVFQKSIARGGCFCNVFAIFNHLHIIVIEGISDGRAYTTLFRKSAMNFHLAPEAIFLLPFKKKRDYHPANTGNRI